MAAPSAVAPILDAALQHEKPETKLETEPMESPPSISEDEVRVLSPSEYIPAAATLAAAFANDDIVRYPIDTPDNAEMTDAQRYELHQTAMEYLVYAHCLNGLVLTIGPSYACVALWLPPKMNIDDWYTIIRSGMWRLKFQLSPIGRERFFTEFLPLLGRTKAEVMGDRDNDSWYLNYVGTRAEARGKGYARTLVRYVTDMADREGKACYLESSHESNARLYGGLGFEIKKCIYLGGKVEELQDEKEVCADGKGEKGEEGPDVGGGRFKMDVMVREPRVPL
jgi:GNAT superfamily N-acetyltransferase